GAVSISSAAVELVHTKVDNLPAYKITIVGAGKMACLLVKHMLSKGVTDISIVNRSHRRAQKLCEQFANANLKIYPISEMMTAVAQSDLVFTSTGATEPILNREKLEAHLTLERPLMLVDISVPRNVAADVNEINGVHVYNVDDLKAVVAANQETRRQLAEEAEVIIEEEVYNYILWWRSLETVPTISCLRNKVETIREQEMEKALSRLGSEFGEKHQEVIEALTRGIVNKILHEPMVQLKAQQDIEARRHCLRSLQMLFNLDTEEQYS
ncbi:MAG: glutamyl-tRNA reductase, partial [Waterburya sp.]